MTTDQNFVSSTPIISTSTLANGGSTVRGKTPQATPKPLITTQLITTPLITTPLITIPLITTPHTPNWIKVHMTTDSDSDSTTITTTISTSRAFVSLTPRISTSTSTTVGTTVRGDIRQATTRKPRKTTRPQITTTNRNTEARKDFLPDLITSTSTLEISTATTDGTTVKGVVPPA